MDFFAGFDSAELVGLALAGLFGLLPGFRLFSWLKVKLNLEDQWAHYMVLVTSLLVTGGAMFIAGELDIGELEFNLTNLLEYAGVLYVASQITFKRLNV